MRNVKSADCLADITGEDVLDSRDLEELITRLEDEEEEAKNAKAEYDSAVTDYQTEMESYDPEDGGEEPEEPDEPEEFDADKKELLDALKELRDDTDGRGWKDGIGFVNESYWREHCESEAEELGYLPSGGAGSSGNPLWQCIDWDKWADMMAQDYSTVEVGGTTFYFLDA